MYGAAVGRAGTLLLRAIMFCDEVDQTDLNATAPADFDRILQAPGAQLVDSNGAGAVIGFVTAGAAIDAALAVVKQHPTFGAGVSLGEVLVEGDDWIGTSVIEAARLLQIATAGQVLVTAHTADIAAASDRSAFREIGPRLLKGIPGEVDVLEALTPVPWTEPLQVALAIDMVESTQLLARRGDEESLRIRRLFDAIMGAACDEHGGDISDQRGDGVLLNFASVSAAASAAINVVCAIKKASLRVDVDDAFAVRAALSCQPGTQAATMANALMGRASPGQILADGNAHKLSRDRGIEFDASTAEFLVVVAPSIALPLPRALRSESAFVGRSDVLQRLTAQWDLAAGGRLTLVDVTGEPGMGKTRVVSEFVQTAAAQGAMVLYGGCDPELDIPYGAILNALDQVPSLDPDVAEAVDFGTSEAVLAGGTNLAAAADTADREEAFARFAQTFVQLTDRRPIVLVLEDLHWANASTLLLLRHIVTAAPSIRLLVIGTYRPLEIGRGHPLLDLQSELLRIGALPVSIELSPLRADEVTELVESQLGGRADDSALELAHRVHRETNGSPFYSQELLRTLIAAGELLSVDGVVSATGDIDALPIPETVRGVVTARLNQLDDDVYRLLSLGAVAGPQFSLDVASAALDRPFDVIVDLAEAAEQVALVTEGDQPRSYAFEHAIVRSTLLDGLSATRLAANHEAIAVALEHMPGDRTDALAHHWTRAAGPVAHDRALKYLGLAAERDVQVLAWEAASSRYRLILDRLGVPSAAPSEQVAETWLGLGAALRAVGDADYLDAVIEAGRCARQINRADLLAKAAIGSMKPGAWFANANQTNDAIIGFCEDALTGLGDEDPVRVQVLAILATSLAFESDRGRRVDLVGEAVQLARSLGDPTVLASALIAEHLALWDPTSLDRRVEIADELGQIARRRDLPEVEFLAGFFQASAMLEMCRVHETRAQLKKLAPIIERTGNFWFFFLVERMRIGLDIGQDVPGAGAAVDALFEESAASQADAGGTWAAQHGGLAIHAGRMGDMADSLRSASEGRRGQGIWSNALVIALLERGDLDEAKALAQELKEPNLDFMWLVSMQMRAEVGYGLGDKDICRYAVEELLPFRDRLGVIASGTLTYGLVATSIGEAAIGAGDFDLAIDVLNQAASDARRLEMPFFEQKSLRLLDEAIEKRGGNA